MHERDGWMPDLPDLIRMNQLVRGRIDFTGFDRWYDSLLPAQRFALTDMLYLLSTQAGLRDEVFSEAFEAAKLTPEHPVVSRFLTARHERRSFDPQHFLAPLDESERRVAFRLFAALFGVAEGRVFCGETPEHCNHWWHRDLLDRRVVQALLRNPGYFHTSMRNDDALKPRMSEHDWLSANDADQMLAFIYGRTSPGKFRLAYSTIFHRHWNALVGGHNPEHAQETLLPPPGATFAETALWGIREVGHRCRRFVEKHSGGPLEETQRAALHQEATIHTDPTRRPGVLALVVPDDELEVAVRQAMTQLRGRSGWPTDGYLMRELFGNPFRPLVLELAWLTADVLALAEGIRRDRTFDGMPVLADALQEAGCDCAPLLDHLRDGCLFTIADDIWRAGSHLPGCWALDLILGGVTAGRHVTRLSPVRLDCFL